MDVLNRMLSKIAISAVKKKQSIVKEVMDEPEKFKLEAYIENEEIIVKIKKKES